MTTTQILDDLASDIERLRLAADLLARVEDDPMLHNVALSLRKRADIMSGRLAMLGADSAQVDPDS